MSVLAQPRRLLLAAVLLVLAGATAFGLIHVVGGLVNGNDRAVGFGLVLAAAAGGLLALTASQARRRVLP